MTVNDVKVPLFSFFSRKEVFDLDKDFVEIIAFSDTPEIDKEIISLALREFEEQKIVSRITLQDKKRIFV